MMTSKRVCSSTVCNEARHACVYSNWLKTGTMIETSTFSCRGKRSDVSGTRRQGQLERLQQLRGAAVLPAADFSFRLRNPGNLWDQSGFDFIVDLCELRVFGAPFAIGGNNLFKMSVTLRCFSARQVCFQRRPGIGQFPPARSPQLAGSVFRILKKSRKSSGILQLFA